MNVFATVSKGRRSPVVQQPTTLQLVARETVWNYEGGIKLASGGVSGSLGVYYQVYDNFQVSVEELDEDGNPTGGFITQSAGAASNLGVEAEIAVEATDWLSFFGNVGYIDGGIDEDNSFAPEFSGARFRLQPEWQAAAGFTVDYPLGGGAPRPQRPGQREPVGARDHRRAGIDVLGHRHQGPAPIVEVPFEELTEVPDRPGEAVELHHQQGVGIAVPKEPERSLKPRALQALGAVARVCDHLDDVEVVELRVRLHLGTLGVHRDAVFGLLVGRDPEIGDGARSGRGRFHLGLLGREEEYDQAMGAVKRRFTTRRARPR